MQDIFEVNREGVRLEVTWDLIGRIAFTVFMLICVLAMIVFGLLSAAKPSA